MITKPSTKTVKNYQNSFVRIGISIFAGIAFSLFIASPVFCQTSYYSDSWFVAGTGASSTAVGCGVTNDSYNPYGHEYTVTTTITSPDGRTETNSASTEGASNVRIDVSIPIYFGDAYQPGDFLVNTVHEGVCPYYNMELRTVYTEALQPVSLKKTAWQLSAENSLTCFYSSTCTGICLPIGGIYQFAKKLYPGGCPRPYIQCEELYVGGQCFPDTRVCKDQVNEGTCDQ